MRFLCAVVLFAYFNQRHISADIATNEPTLCPADFWARQRQRIERTLDETVQPCDDFYEYACGNWRASYRLRTLGARDMLTGVRADNKRQLMQYFHEMEENADTLPPAERALVNFYNSCLETRLRSEEERNGGDIMRVYTNELRQYASWPILDAEFGGEASTRGADATAFDWAYVSAQLRQYGVQSFWKLQLLPNWQAAEQQVFYVTAPGFEHLKKHARADRLDSDAEYLHSTYVKHLLLDLGVRTRMAKTNAAEVMEFEKALFELVEAQASIVLQAPRTLESLMSALHGIDLRKYFDTLLATGEGTPQLPADYAKRLLVVADESYLRRLGALLQRTSAETIGKYLLVQFLAHFEVHLHADDTYTQHKQNCLQRLRDFMPQELTRVFLKLRHTDSAAFMQRTNHDLQAIFAKLKVQFELMLNTTSIFERDTLTRVLGLEKLRSMRLLLPQLGEERADATTTTDSVEIDKFYDQNLLALSKRKAKAELQALVRALVAPAVTPSSESSNYTPLDVNAYYRLKKNAIELPIGLLRPPFYDACQRAPIVYGSLVYIIGHELLHGFDYDGLNYDKSGNVANDWGVKSIIRFGTKSNCYLGERYKNGALTINENIADSEGLRLALVTFLAGLKSDADVTDRTALATDMKLFFISFAQTWCGENTAAESSLHADHRERVNNAVSNFPEFIEAFQCKAGSDMDAEEKCRIW